MGFFKDFKRDFAQAVNELMPDKDELAAEYDDEDMVNTFDEADDIEVAPEDIFEDLDEIKIDAVQDEALDTFSVEEPVEEEEETNAVGDIMDSIPEAEVEISLSFSLRIICYFFVSSHPFRRGIITDGVAFSLTANEHIFFR